MGSTQPTIFVGKKVGSMQGRAKLRGTRNALRILPRAGPHVHPFDAETFRLWKPLLTRGPHSTPCAERATRYDAKSFACEDSLKKRSFIFSSKGPKKSLSFFSKQPKIIFNLFIQVPKNYL